MKKSIYILGINTAYHELAACLVKDGRLVVAAEEERFNRVKHGKLACIDNPHVLPTQSIDFCLKIAGISLREITHIGLPFWPEGRLQNINADKFYTINNWGSESGERIFYRKLLTIPRTLSRLSGVDLTQRIHWVPHHLSHAASAFFVSPFKDAAVLSIDGIGEMASAWFGYGNRHSLRTLNELYYPNSLGFLWEKLSKFLGFLEYDASKVMGLAAYGDWRKFYQHFKKIVSMDSDGALKIDNNLLRFRKEDYRALEQLFGVRKLRNPIERTKDHEDIAATLQKITNETMIRFAAFLAQKTKSHNLCLAGGVALNCVSNYEIMKTGYFRNIYIQPAAHDAGTALGAAFYIWNTILGGERSFVMGHTYWGPKYTEKEILTALNLHELQYRRSENIEEETARLIANGNIVGWFQGRMEWGPRALGNRSLLVDPRKKEAKEILNTCIKKRESFRPFAPSVLAEDAHDWFDIPLNCQSISTEFMEFSFPVRKTCRKLIPAVTHIDGTSRLQIVTRMSNPKYHRLLKQFKKITGVPLVLNTSFNENEPIVCSPRDAIKTFLRTKMDYLAIGDYLIQKTPPR